MTEKDYATMSAQERHEDTYQQARKVRKENERLIKENARLVSEIERLRAALEYAESNHGSGCECHLCKHDAWWDS